MIVDKFNNEINRSRPIIQYDLDGNKIAEFSNVKEAAKQFGGKNSDWIKIYHHAALGYGKFKRKKKPRPTFGFYWKFK